MSLETLELLASILDAQQISVSHPNFAEFANALIVAKSEILQAINEAKSVSN